MSSIIEGFNFDIFISYHQNDNKHDGWVSDFVENLKGELESTFKEDISVYFDISRDDGLLETHDVDASLKEKLKCLVFIPVITCTYCDPKASAWEHEFNTFADHVAHVNEDTRADIWERLGNNTLTRRKFVEGVAGSAVCCTCLSLDFLEAFDKEQGQKIEDARDKGHLASVCGTYCGACPAYIAKHSVDEQIKMRHQKRFSSGPMKARKTIPDQGWMDGILCDGCLSGGQIAAHCQSCAIKACTVNKQNVIRCSDCKELPCYRITNMINTGLLHRAEYMPNLEKIREMGVQEWVKYEEERWRCPRCGLPMSWYDAECAGCGAPRSEKLFPVI